MFDISWSELMLIGVVALIVIGPKELPGVLRTLGQMMRKVRGMASDFQNQFQEAMREAEMADLKKEVDNLAQDFTNFDPLKDVRTDVENMGKDLNEGLSKDLNTDLTKDLETPADAKPDAPAIEPPVAPADAPASVADAGLPEPPPVAAPAAEFPLPQAASELADADAAAAGVAPAAPEPAKPDTGGRAA